jgi:hypothetical protein
VAAVHELSVAIELNIEICQRVQPFARARADIVPRSEQQRAMHSIGDDGVGRRKFPVGKNRLYDLDPMRYPRNTRKQRSASWALSAGFARASAQANGRKPTAHGEAHSSTGERDAPAPDRRGFGVRMRSHRVYEKTPPKGLAENPWKRIILDAQCVA